ncbi:unnamed protein product [Mycena citricolor]|uniref:Uncharacterized protein n=1 Tax=Mycena citricolor TaxID=2018698 RepID=A0AAD2K1K9_9AGAR|nr:unnamed protein product [Mycena citricolor]CAK5273701.1 unnamed protein product [Mycena citricolor]
MASTQARGTVTGTEFIGPASYYTRRVTDFVDGKDSAASYPNKGIRGRMTRTSVAKDRPRG